MFVMFPPFFPIPFPAILYVQGSRRECRSRKQGWRCHLYSTMHFSFCPTTRLGSFSSWFRFPWPCIIALCRISHFMTASFPDGTFLQFSLVLWCLPWRLSWRQLWRSNLRWVRTCFALATFAFMSGSPPSMVDSVYVGFSHWRGGCQACRSQSHLVIICSGSVKTLLLGFHWLECWVLGLRFFTFKIWDFYVVIFLPYTCWSHIGSIHNVDYYSCFSGFCGKKFGRFSSTRAKPITLV